MYISIEKAKSLLDNGHSITAHGKNLDTLTKKKDGNYSWEGMFDQDETILSWEEASELIPNRKWQIQ